MTNPINGGNQGVDRALAETLRSRQKTEIADQPGGRRPPDDAGAETASARASQSDRLQAVSAAIDQAPDIDQDRVESIRQSIADGSYPLDADRIAEKFIELEGLLER